MSCCWSSLGQVPSVYSVTAAQVQPHTACKAQVYSTTGARIQTVMQRNSVRRCVAAVQLFSWFCSSLGQVSSVYNVTAAQHSGTQHAKQKCTAGGLTAEGCNRQCQLRVSVITTLQAASPCLRPLATKPAACQHCGTCHNNPATSAICCRRASM
jgi:hypothetical protein